MGWDLSYNIYGLFWNINDGRNICRNLKIQEKALEKFKNLQMGMKIPQ